MSKLIIAASLDIAITIILYLIWHKNKPEQDSHKNKIRRQIIAGLLFGASAIFATENAIFVGGAAINIRDAAPLCAGLIFGGPAGIIAGFIGGIERAIAINWGAAQYTVIACTLSTCLAGLFAAVLRKFIFDSKIPPILYGLFSAVVMETIHMLMVFFTHMDDIQMAFTIVKKCTMPMIVINSVAVMLSIVAVKVLSNKQTEKNHLLKISQSFQRALMICIVFVFILSSLFINITQTRLAEKNASYLLSVNIDDALAALSDSSTDVAYVTDNRHVGNTGYMLIADSSQTIVGGQALGESLSDLNLDLSVANEGLTLSGDIDNIASRYMFTQSNGYTIIAVIPEEEVIRAGSLSTYMNVFIEILLFAVLFILVYYLIRKQIVENINKINKSLAQITNGNLDTVVDVRTNREFASLSDDINSTVVTLKNYIAEASARIDKELEFAKEIQNSSLPTITEAIKNDGRYTIYAKMSPAKEVGGDFYDYYYIGERYFVITVADVSGKGIPAAMFMMRAKATLKGLAEEALSVAKIMQEANTHLCSGNDSGMFVTAWVGIVDLETGMMHSSSAGHNPPLIMKKNGEVSFYKYKTGFVLAGMESIRYKEYELALEPGDKILLYTDGVTEATDSYNALYGDDRLLSLICENYSSSPLSICNAVLSDIDTFVKEAPQFDDITLLCFEYNGENDSDENSIELPAVITNIAKVTDFVEDKMSSSGFPAKFISQINIVIDEIVSNISNYAYTPNTGSVEVCLKISDNPHAITLSFIDNGIAYNPLERTDPDITLPESKRQIGGLGILMVKNIVDEISYKRCDGQNILTISKVSNL
ncbi:MAG: SpoIIE family protein phosphatase [Clostridiales bacterium]|jgi:anti-sigma regulatory factor (Ser/Thr protein kinase)|nr:SpoIIE family protein phosphatase [Clostridiales bacterium]